MRPAAFIYHKIRVRRCVRGRRCHRWTAAPVAAAPNRSAAARTTDDPIAICTFGRTACVRAAPRQPTAVIPSIFARADVADVERAGSENPSMSVYPTCAIAKRFDVKGAAQNAAAQLPSLFREAPESRGTWLALPSRNGSRSKARTRSRRRCARSARRGENAFQTGIRDAGQGVKLDAVEAAAKKGRRECRRDAPAGPYPSPGRQPRARRDGTRRPELIFRHSASADGCNAWHVRSVVSSGLKTKYPLYRKMGYQV